MLAVWLLATNHAVFELAGVMKAEHAVGLDAGQHRWHQVENTLTKQKTDLPTKPLVIEAVLPLLEVVLLSAAKSTHIAPPEFPAIESERRAVQSWRFAQRAAPLPGAPSALI